jgi:hypothetical protein
MARLFALALAALLTLASGDAFAAAGKLKAHETIATTASPEAVWAVIGEFDAISKWHPVVASSPADKGNEVGSVRALTLKADGNPGFSEKLLKYSAEKHSYKYSIVAVDPKILPVTNYTSIIKVKKTKTGSTIDWSGRFDAPEGVDPATSVGAITGVYKGGLTNIKALAEKR